MTVSRFKYILHRSISYLLYFCYTQPSSHRSVNPTSKIMSNGDKLTLTFCKNRKKTHLNADGKTKEFGNNHYLNNMPVLFNTKSHKTVGPFSSLL